MMRIDGGGSVRTDPTAYPPPPPPPAPPEEQPPASPTNLEAAATQERLTAAAPYFGGDRPHWRYTSSVPQPSPGPAPTPPTPNTEPPARPEDRPGAGEVMGPALGAAAIAAAADGPIPVGDVIAIGILVGGATAPASASEGGETPEVPQVEPQPTPGPETAMPDPSTLTGEQKRDWVTNPENLRGRSPEEIESMIPDNWVRLPAREGDGVRYSNPERNGEQVRIMEPPGHLPANADPTKSGPYARVSRDGTTSDPIPLEGNPTLPR